MKHRIVHVLQKYVLNLPIKLALAIGLPLPGYALKKATIKRLIGPPCVRDSSASRSSLRLGQCA
jgi:hypothetical protein